MFLMKKVSFIRHEMINEFTICKEMIGKIGYYFL